MRFHYPVLFGLLSAAAVYAQHGSLASPSMGFAFDAASGSIRPIRGVPGAALLGEGIDAGSPLASAAISPRQDYALAIGSAGERLRLIPLAAQVNGTALPEETMAAPERMIFSPSGSAALLVQADRVQILAGLPGHVTATSLDLSAISPVPTALAVADDGALAAVADAGAAWIVASDGGSLQLALPGSTVALAFRRNSRDLLAISAAGDVYLVHNPGPDSGYRMLYSGDEQTADPVAAQFSWGGDRAYTVNSRGNIVVIDMEGGAWSAISCGCRTTALDPLNARNLFRLTAPGRSPVMLFDGSGSEARVWFVPPGNSGRASEGSIQ